MRMRFRRRRRRCFLNIVPSTCSARMTYTLCISFAALYYYYYCCLLQFPLKIETSRRLVLVIPLSPPSCMCLRKLCVHIYIPVHHHLPLTKQKTKELGEKLQSQQQQ